MPCRDYDSRWDDSWSQKARDADTKAIKEHTDKLARIACKAMTELVKSGHADFLILKDDEVREWWEQHQEADRKAQEAKLEKQRRAQIKKEALAKLSDEEKKILGIKK
jgi:cytosine/adenosine deaminase-related metal-dependent hydrolase